MFRMFYRSLDIDGGHGSKLRGGAAKAQEPRTMSHRTRTKKRTRMRRRRRTKKLVTMQEEVVI